MRRHILCLGDSNTHGYYPDPQGGLPLRYDEGQRWTTRLGAQLGADYLVIEEGLSGRTTVFDDPLTPGLSALDYLHPCLMSHQPLDLLIIMLGTNDVKERISMTPACVGLGMARLVRAAKVVDCWGRESRPNILIISPPPIGEGQATAPVAATMGQGCVEKSRQLAAEYRRIAGELGVHFWDAAALDDPYNTIDFMHLTPAAHVQLADVLTDLVPTLL